MANPRRRVRQARGNPAPNQPAPANVPVPGPQYLEKGDHRDGTAIKSQWVITFVQEQQAFQLSRNAGWSPGPRGWGLHLAGAQPQYLGRGARAQQRHGVDLFIARFDEGNPNVWHGCPSDPQINNQDVPPDAVLQDWVAQQYISRPQQRRIMRCQRCTL